MTVMNPMVIFRRKVTWKNEHEQYETKKKNSTSLPDLNAAGDSKKKDLSSLNWRLKALHLNNDFLV